MSMISELVKELREFEDLTNPKLYSPKITQKLLLQAADTIESLSEKLQAANMEKSERYYNGGWILNENRKPETRNNILICQKDGYVSIGYYSQKEFLDLNSFPFEEVIAWQYLPSPYRP